jgi:NAD(P)-dependent dehydrogenase (short-subunit alcohol dehydrogenase family)
MPISIRDKVVVVTGGAGEMGRSICQRLVEEGAAVVMVDIAPEGREITSEIKKQKRGNKIVFVRADVTSEKDMDKMAATALKSFGRIDALINNAGLFTAMPWDELTYDEWKKRLRVNVDGVFLATRAVVPAMREQGKGKIINIGSDTVWMGTPGFAHYVTSKAAILGFTRALANELGPQGITTCYVTPTLLDTPGTREAFPQGHFDYVLSHTPIGRFEKPEDVNGLLVFLVSDDAAFVNGAAINIGGGISMH